MILVVSSLIIFSSCTKKDVPPSGTDPVMRGTWGGKVSVDASTYTFDVNFSFDTNNKDSVTIFGKYPAAGIPGAVVDEPYSYRGIWGIVDGRLKITYFKPTPLGGPGAGHLEIFSSTGYDGSIIYGDWFTSTTSTRVGSFQVYKR